jgi:hypothetical protein
MNKKIIAFSVQIFIILLSVLVAVFLISVPYEASLIKVVIPTSPSQFSYMIKNGTLYIQTNSLIINNGFYDLNDLSLFISVYTLSNFQIAYLYLGFPYQNIVIKHGSSYVLPINIPVNIASIINTNLMNELIKEEQIKLQIITSGRYAFNVFPFKLELNQIIPFQIPIENITVDTSKLMNPSSWIVNETGIFVPLSVNYIGTIKLSNVEVKGNVVNSSGYVLFNFSSLITSLQPGNNIILTKIAVSKTAFLELFSENETISINLNIFAAGLQFSKMYKFSWITPISFLVEDIVITPIYKNQTTILAKVNFKNNLPSNILIKGILITYNNSTNKIINSTPIELNINAGSSVHYEIMQILNNVSHGNVITIEFFITFPIELPYALFKQTFILP